MDPSNTDRLQDSQNQGMQLILGVPLGTRAKIMRTTDDFSGTQSKTLQKDSMKPKLSITRYYQQIILNGWASTIQETDSLKNI